MHHLVRRLFERARGARGFTLVEVLVALTMGLVVIGGAVFVFNGAVHSQRGITSSASQVQQARTTMERLVRELRQGTTVSTATASQLTFVTYVDSSTCGGTSATTAIQCQVTYACTAGSCTRVERNPDGSGGGSAVTVVSGLSSSSVFSYSPSSSSPNYVGVSFAYSPSPGQAAVTLADGAAFAGLGTPS